MSQIVCHRTHVLDNICIYIYIYIHNHEMLKTVIGTILIRYTKNILRANETQAIIIRGLEL